jgi:hypothetical protein
MPPRIDITGRWVGAYFQHGREHPLTADFAQIDSHLQGKMTDGVTEFESSVFDAAMEAGLPPGADEQIVANLRKQRPDLPPGPIRATATLPSASILEGEVQGQTVRFRKTYLGEHFTGWRVGNCLIGSTVNVHVVQFRGRLSDDANSLEGQWFVDGDQKTGMRRLEGGFILRRLED